MKANLIFALIFLVASTCVYSQEWRQTASTPEGSGVTEMVVRQSNGHIFVTTGSFNWPNGDMGGVRRSTDDGATWENVSAEAFRLWGIYVNILSPDSVTRVAVRYINKIEIPLETVDLNEYLVVPPTLPSGVAMSIKSFLSRIVVEDTTSGILANIIQATDDSGITNTHIPIILDNDVYKRQNFVLNGMREIFDTFEKLCEIKNKIFFESITEKTARMYE